jgi:hypothetical protein
MPITCEEDTFSGKFVLSWFPEDDLAETGETFSGLNLGWDAPKPFFDRGGKACGIISDVIHKKIQFEENLCYLGFHKTIWSTKERPHGD